MLGQRVAHVEEMGELLKSANDGNQLTWALEFGFDILIGLGFQG